MTLTKRVGVVAGVAVMSTTAVGFASDATSNDDLQARIAELEATVQQLQGGQEWVTEMRAAEIRGIVDDVLSDASTRASLLQGGGTAGYDGDFFLASADGNFRLEIGGQLGIRWSLSTRDRDSSSSSSGSPGLGSSSSSGPAIIEAGDHTFVGPGPFSSMFIDSTQNGFENRRTKLIFQGHVFNPQWMYRIQMEFGRSGGFARLQDAWIGYDYGNGWDVTLGQMKAPFLREELVSSARQLAVERSLLADFFTLDRVQGLRLNYAGETTRFSVMYHDGARTLNTGIIGADSPSGHPPIFLGDFEGETEFAIAARGEVLLSGNWAQFNDFASWQGSEQGLLIGAAVNFEKGAAGTFGTAPHEETFSWTVDGSYEADGWNLFAAVVGNHQDSSGVDQFGFVVQGGVFLNENWEFFARYEWGDMDLLGVDDLSVLTVGVNDYIDGHNLKWTTDVGFGFDDTFVWANSGADYAGGRDEIVVRTQLQLLF